MIGMKVNLFTGYCPKEMYGLSRYDRNLLDYLDVDKNIVCMKDRFSLPLDIIRYRFMKHPKADINHVTNETFAMVLGGVSGKKIATVFDMGVLVLKDEYGPLQRFFYKFNLNELKKADHVITASKVMRDMLVDKFGFSRENISVIYLGVEPKFIQEPKKFLKKDCYQIVYVGNEKSHKNFMQVLETMKILNKTGKFRLVKIGRPQSKNRKKHIAFAKQNNINIKFVDYVNDAELIEVYRQSDIFITMSDYEGFCFPPLEAAASGIPIVLKDSPTLKEVYGEVAVFARTPEIAAKNILLLTSDKKKYENSAKMANEFARKMTWEKCAKQVEEVYRKVLQ